MQNTTDTTSPIAAPADAQPSPAHRPQSLPFAGSARSTLGVEWELALIDRDSLDLRQCAEEILQKVGPDPHVHGEMMLNTIELVSGARRTVAECMEDIAFAFDRVLPVTDPLRVDLASAGTHPFADPLVQKVTNAERYARLVDRTRLWGHQMLIFGTHVHVGVEDRSKVLPILKALLTRTAHLQCLSASSPFWAGADTGYADNRAMMFQQLPTAGAPEQFSTWEQLESYTGDLVHTGVIEDFTEGSFQPVIGDRSGINPAQVERVVFVSGRLYYDLEAERERRGDTKTAIVSVEQLYPLPEQEIKEQLALYSNATDIVWAQDEPANQGQWPFMALNLLPIIDYRMRLVSRPASASPAAGTGKRHAAEAEALMKQVFEG